MKGWTYFLDLFRKAVKARSQTGKPILSQMREMVRLHRVQLGPHDYYFYRLFDDSRFTMEQKRQYTSWRFQAHVYPSINDPALIAKDGLPGGWGGAVDKLLYHCIMSAADLPVPRILAIYDPSRSFCGSIPVYSTIDQLAQFVESRGSKPFFLKPAHEGTGHGAMAVVNVRGERVRFANGNEMEMRSFLDEVARHERVLFQERLRPHPLLEKTVGQTIATVRVVTLVRKTSSEFHRTVFRIPVGKNMVDNFEEGKTGNLVGWVNPTTGEVERVFQGVGFDQVQVTHHPDTGEPLQGLKLPDWDRALDLVYKASRVLMGMPFQAWDLALTDRGPMLVEVNDESSQDVLQLAGPPGMLDEKLCRFLQEYGVRWTYPLLPQLPLNISGTLPHPKSV